MNQKIVCLTNFLFIYNRVETEREMPKLKLFIGKYKKRTRAPYEFLQEFQYGKNSPDHNK